MNSKVRVHRAKRHGEKGGGEEKRVRVCERESVGEGGREIGRVRVCMCVLGEGREKCTHHHHHHHHCPHVHIHSGLDNDCSACGRGCDATQRVDGRAALQGRVV